MQGSNILIRIPRESIHALHNGGTTQEFLQSIEFEYPNDDGDYLHENEGTGGVLPEWVTPNLDTDDFVFETTDTV